MKKEIECSVCDNYFVIRFKSGDPVAFCPFCGDEINPDDGNDYEDDVPSLIDD